MIATKPNAAVVVTGGPATGKTTAVSEVALAQLDSKTAPNLWAPVVVVTPERRRATALDYKFLEELGAAGANLNASGGHRLVRSFLSYAYLIVSTWMVEREHPQNPPLLLSAASEDTWLAAWLDEHPGAWDKHFDAEVVASPKFRGQIRSLMFQAGHHGLLPSDMEALAVKVSQPMWEVAAKAYEAYTGGDEVAFTTATAHFDPARMPYIAANVIDHWQADAAKAGVLAQAPVPDVLIADDVQDMPPSFGVLAGACARLGAAVLATEGKNVRAFTHLGASDATARTVLGRVMAVTEVEAKGGKRPGAAQITNAVGAWLPATGQETVLEGPEGTVTADTANTVTDMLTHMAHWLQATHLEDGVEYKDMAVATRSREQAEMVRHALGRLQIPVRVGDVPAELGKEALNQPILTLLAGDVDDDGLQEIATSPLIGADTLNLHRLHRAFKQHEDNDNATLTELITACGEDGFVGGRGLKATSDHLKTLHHLIQIAPAAAQLSADEGVFQIWDAASVATSLRNQATSEASLASQQANTALDAVLALLRKTELWTQERTQHDQTATAKDFADFMLTATALSDPLETHALVREGVAVLTPGDLAGQEWDTVALPFLNADAWPDSGRDGLGDVDTFTYALAALVHDGWMPATPITDWRNTETIVKNVDHSRNKRIEEAQLFYVAASRAAGRVGLFSVEDTDTTPSVFVHLVKEDVDTQAVEVGDVPVTGLAGMVARLRVEGLESNPNEKERAEAAAGLAYLANAGVTAANPVSWGTTGGVTTSETENKPLVVSPSHLQVGEDCPLKWFMTTRGARDLDLDRDPTRFTRLTRGVAMHELAEQFPRGPRTAVVDAFEKLWDENGWETETTWGRRIYEETAEMVNRLGRFLEATDPDVEILSEVPLKFELEGVTVKGRADRVEVKDGVARVIDIKTGRPPTVADAKDSLQLLSYQLGVQSLGYEPGGAALYTPASGVSGVLREQAPLAGRQSEGEERIEELAKRLTGPTYAATPNAGCRMCPFKMVCPTQTAGERATE